MTSRLPLQVLIVGAALAAMPIHPAAAGIKLITLPVRERVEIQLDHPGATLVEEERVVPLAVGVNDVVFAWANTNIDKGSIQFRCLTHPERIKVLSVSYPPGENALTWQVFRVAGWDDREQWVDRIRNYRSKPIDVEIRRTFGGHAIFESSLDPTLYDYRTPQFSARVEAGRPTELGYVVTYRQGINHKQDNVTIKKKS